MPDRDLQSEPELPRFHPNNLHLAIGPFDLTITWIESDPTIMPDEQVGPHGQPDRAVAQTVLPLGMAKAMIPLLVKQIAQYESGFGEIPAPGFDALSKE